MLGLTQGALHTAKRSDWIVRAGLSKPAQRVTCNGVVKAASNGQATEAGNKGLSFLDN